MIFCCAESFVHGSAEAQWSTAMAVTGGMQGSPGQPFLSVTRGKNVAIVWSHKLDGDGSRGEIFYREYDGSAWTAPKNISNTPTPSFHPAVIGNTKGDLFFFWGERVGVPSPRPVQYPNSIFFQAITGEQDTGRVVLYSRETDGGMPRPSVGFDSDGRLYVVWMSAIDDTVGTYPLHLRVRDNSGWGPERTTGTFTVTPSMSVTNTGILHAVFISGEPGTGGNSVFTTSTTNQGVSWSGRTLVHSSGIDPAFDPRIVHDARGWIHILWLKSFRNSPFPEAIYHSKSLNGLAWETPLNLAAGLRATMFAITVVVDKEGFLHAVFDAEGSLYYTSYNGICWGQPEHITVAALGAHEPELAIDSLNTLHLVWQDISTTPYTIKYSTRQAEVKTCSPGAPLSPIVLFQNFPNPVSTFTSFEVELAADSHVLLQLFDVLGRGCATIFQGLREKGRSNFVFNAEDLPPGVYFYRLSTGLHTETRKLIVLK